jgi:branched-chain amino acid transport system substrate-binding protein
MRGALAPWTSTLAGLALAALLAGVGSAADPPPYRDLSRAGAGFFGPGREDPPPVGLTSIRLGVFGPAHKPAGERLRAAVTLAVSEANARGGYHGLPYEVRFRADDGPWGMGAKQVVALAYEDSVWAILGGLEGGDAHVAELVAAKIWTPVITPTAADLSIDYANVPWVFRCFPSDDRQARLLLEHVLAHGHRRVTVFTEGDREGRTGWRRLADEARVAGVELAVHEEYASSLPAEAVERVDLAGVDAVLVWGRSETAVELIAALRARGFAGPTLGPACLLSPALLAPPPELGTLVVAAPYDLTRADDRIETFRRRFQEATGGPADPVALFAYDAACAVLSAIDEAGPNRVRIRDALAAGSFAGTAGTIEFDDLGGSSLGPVLMMARKGAWVRVSSTEPRTAGR